MKKIKKKYILIIIGILIGLVISVGGVYAAVTITGSNVTYSNSSSGLTSTTVQGAIDELNNKTDIRKMSNFVSVYKYSTATSTKCITGEEDTCVKSTCHKTKTSGSCPAGTIIKYKVNDATVVTFHVMFDNGSTLTMQSQKNISYNSAWYGTSTSDTNTSGPMALLPLLESITAGWSNVNNQTYTMGTTVFKTNAYTGCSDYNSCTTNTYTLASRTSKARMITVQEAAALGCLGISTPKSCPIWMYNYLNNSTSYGGTINDSAASSGYWTMSASTNSLVGAFFIYYYGQLRYDNYVCRTLGARAVVVVSK